MIIVCRPFCFRRGLIVPAKFEVTANSFAVITMPCQSYVNTKGFHNSVRGKWAHLLYDESYSSVE